MKYIVVTGGVISGLGKGITASSIGVLLKQAGLSVTAVKIDPYLNIDSGTMSPIEHGECYVLDDGGETDLDLGNYERFLNLNLSTCNNITTGKVYKRVLDKERRGDYLGKTVQIVPHLTDEIQTMIVEAAKHPVDGEGNLDSNGIPVLPDVCIVELGGTVGDIESMPFIEALRNLSLKNRGDFCFVHVSLVPFVGELKTKPTQHSVKELRSSGISPDFICIRCPEHINENVRNKLSSFCNVSPDNIIVNVDVPNIYYVPELFRSQNFESKLMEHLNLKQSAGFSDLNTVTPVWSKYINHFENRDLPTVRVALVGKYTGLKDSYLSVIRALEHASFDAKVQVKVEWINADNLEDCTSGTAWDQLRSCDSVLVPGGYGYRGIEGMIAACNYAKENNMPYLGLCLGMQVLVISEARNLEGLENATSEEFSSESTQKVISFMPDSSLEQLGGTMRLGLHRTIVKNSRFLPDGVVSERHRHRYEVNPKYIEQLETESDLRFTGKDTTGTRMEIAELINTTSSSSSKTKHCAIGVQFHPELRSRAETPSIFFVRFLQSAVVARLK